MDKRKKAEAALLATTFIWGGTFVAQKVGLRDISPLTFTAIRFSVAALILLAGFWRRIFPLSGPAILKGAFLGGLLFAGFATQTVGLAYTTASKSAFITGMMVILVPILQVFVERRPPKYGNVAGVLIVAVGLWFLTSPTGSDFNKGDALTIICAIMFAGYIVYLDIVSKEMTPMQLTFLQIASTAVLAAVSMGLFETVQVSFTPASVGVLLYLILLATLTTTFVQTTFQKDTTPTRAVVIFSIEPVFAAVSAYILLGENLGEAGIFGAGLILAGLLLSELSDGIPLLNTPLFGRKTEF